MKQSRSPTPPGGSVIDRWANELLRARQEGRPIGLADEAPELMDIGAGMRVAERLRELLEVQGVGIVGLKFGALDSGAQRALGLPCPLVAPLFEKWILPSGAGVPLSSFVAPKLECEIGLRRACRGWVPMACIEIADSRFQRWSGRGGQVVADFGLNGAIVKGGDLDSAGQGSFEVRHNGELVFAGSASVDAARERVEKYSQGWQVPFVSSGSLHAMMDLDQGEWALSFRDGAQATVTATTSHRDQ